MIRKLSALWVGGALASAPLVAVAQPPAYTTMSDGTNVRTQPTYQVGGGGGGGGAVYGPSAIGVAPSNPPVYTGGIDTAGHLQAMLTDTGGREYVDVYSLPSLPAGTNLIGQIEGRGPATPTQTSVSVPAGASTQLIAANATRRGLQVVPAASGCYLNDGGGTASATSKPIPGGWNYTELDPPPSTAVTAYCTAATTVSVTELN